MTSSVTFQSVTISSTAINAVKDKIRSYVSSVETFSSTCFYARVKIKDVEEYAYIYAKDSNVVISHYCESTTKGIQCTHNAILSSIALQYGHNVTVSTGKLTLKKFKEFAATFDPIVWGDDSEKFDIFNSDEDEQIVEEVPTTLKAGEIEPRDWKKGWNEIQDYLDKQAIEIGLQNKILDLRQAISSNVGLRAKMIAPKKPDTPYNGLMFEEAISHILLGEHLLLIGDAGTGKDTLINTISWVLNYPVLLQVGSKDETKESLVAEPAFINNESTYTLSQVATTVRDGGLINFAEINFLQGSTTSVLHPLFDENKVLPTPIGGIDGNPFVLFCASMNVGEGYAGVNRLNKAFKDRFAVLRLQKTMSFKESLTNKTGLVDSAALEFLEKIKEGLNELFVENIATAADTVRGYIKAANYFFHYGYTQNTRIRAIESYVINRIEEPEEYFQAREAVRDIFNELRLPQFPVTDEERLYNPSL